MATNPLIGAEKLNTDADRRRVRRPLTTDEFGRLVAAAKAGPVVEGTTGRERAIGYILAAYTGFRLRGIRYLRVRDFQFTIQTVTLPPEAAKNGKITAPTPLHPAIVEPLRKFVTGLGPNDRVLPRLTKDVSADGIKADLTAAGIPIVDDRGRVVDFHALRGTFCTWLKNTGTRLEDNQKLMHHSDPSLTSNIYSDTSSEVARAAIMRLPPPPSLD
jgi:integrase